MTVYIEGRDMRNQNDPAREDDKRAWSAPKVERRSMIDRTQNGRRLSNFESGNYYSNS